MTESCDNLEGATGTRTAQLMAANDRLRAEIAARERAEVALQEERNLLRSLVDLLETMDVGVTIQDREYTITYQNSFMQKNFGGLGGKCYETYEKRPNICEGCPVARAFEDGQPHTAERTTPAPGGGVLYWDNTAHPIRDTSGEIRSCFEVVRNVTQRRLTEESLRRERDFAESLIETAHAVVLVLDTSGRIMRFNRYLEELSEYRLEEVRGEDWFATFVPDGDRDRVHGLFARAVTGVPTCGEVSPVVAKDGRQYQIEWYDKPLRDADGNVAGVLAIGLDVTERLILQSQLARAQKLESLGQLAAGIAHEINTPTQYVGDNTRFLRDSVQDLVRIVDRYASLLDAGRDPRSWEERSAEIRAAFEELDIEFLKEEIPNAIEQSLQGVERVAAIVRSMKEFSHPGGDQKQMADLNRAIDCTITVARGEWRHAAEIVTDFDASLPLIPCFLGDFNQVILNMVVNAAQAIKAVVGDTERKGVITINTRRTGSCAEVRISDTGIGIPAEILAKIFDPFFTTKEVGQGTGQGLAIAHAVIVENHGGKIEVESELGQGTTFIIHLPIHSGSTEAEEPDRPE